MSALPYTLTLDNRGTPSLSEAPALRLFPFKRLDKNSSHKVLVLSVLSVPSQNLDKQGLLSSHPETPLSHEIVTSLLNTFSTSRLASGVLSGSLTDPNGVTRFYTNEIHLLSEGSYPTLLQFLLNSGIIIP